jgi:hypothetical protein
LVAGRSPGYPSECRGVFAQHKTSDSVFASFFFFHKRRYVSRPMIVVVILFFSSFLPSVESRLFCSLFSNSLLDVRDTASVYAACSFFFAVVCFAFAWACDIVHCQRRKVRAWSSFLSNSNLSCGSE